jgi:hypothetical protein
MKEPKNYPTLVQEAERAVADVKDPELKRIAFQKILENLLSGADGREKASTPNGQPRGAKSRPSKQPRKARGGPAHYLAELIEEGFFKKPKTIAEVKTELENRGHHIPVTSMSGPLQKKCQDRVLRRKKLKASGKKGPFAYSNW